MDNNVGYQKNLILHMHTQLQTGVNFIKHQRLELCAWNARAVENLARHYLLPFYSDLF